MHPFPSSPAKATIVTLLRNMQETLGRLHDLEMLAKRVRSSEAHAEEHLLEGLATFAERVEIERRELHSQFLKERSSLAAPSSDKESYTLVRQFVR